MTDTHADLIARAERALDEPPLTIVQACMPLVSELVEALKETVHRHNLLEKGRLLPEILRERDRLAAELLESKLIAKDLNEKGADLAAENAKLNENAKRLIAFERTLEDCPPEFEEIFQRHLGDLLA